MPAADQPVSSARASRALAPVADDDGGSTARLADPRWLLPVLFLGSVVLYTVGTSLFFASGAGGQEIALAQRSEWIFRPQHLFGTALLRLWLQLGAAVGLPLPPVALANLLNLVLAGAAVTLTYILLRRLALSRAPALLATLVLAVSNALWDHATTGEAVVMALPFALAALALAAGQRDTDGNPAGDGIIRHGQLRGLLATALFCLAITLGAQMALLLPALLVLVARQAPVGGRSLAVARASALAIVLALGPFLLVAAATEGRQSASTFIDWLFARTDGEALAPVTGGPLQLARAIAGIGRLIFSPSDGESALRALLTGDRTQASLVDRLSLARNLLAALTLLGLALRGALILRRRSPALALGLALPVLAVSTLGTWWLSSEPSLWLPVFPLLLGLAAFGIAPTARSLPVAGRWGLALPVVAAAALLLSLGAGNRCRQAPTLLCAEGGTEWRAAAQVARATTGADLVMGPTGSELMWLPHLRPAARTLQFDQAIPQSVDAVDYLGEIWAAVQDTLASGGRVYVQGLADPLPARLSGAWVSLHSKHGVSRLDLRRLLEREFQRRPAPALGPAVEELLPRPVLAEASP